MATAFVANGLGAYGLRVLAGAGLGSVDSTHYLAIWYTAGLLLAIAVFLFCRRRTTLKEVCIGLLMAICSVLGQAGMAIAMSSGIPGYVVFPVAVGGGLVLVVLVGVSIFHERLSPLLRLGIATGILSLILLALPR